MLKRVRIYGCGSFFLFHHLNESKHFVRSLVGIVFIVIFLEVVLGDEMLTPELINLKAAFVDVKMNISLFKIRGAGLPNTGFGM